MLPCRRHRAGGPMVGQLGLFETEEEVDDEPLATPPIMLSPLCVECGKDLTLGAHSIVYEVDNRTLCPTCYKEMRDA